MKYKNLVCLLFAVMSQFEVHAQQTVYICNGETHLLTASSTGAASYQWYKNGAPLSGAVTDTLTVEEEATFTVTGISAVGCTSDFSDDIFVRIKHPNVLNDSVTLDSATQIAVLLNDTSYCSPFALNTLSIVQQPLKGTVTIQANGIFLYTPDPNAQGTDSFTYTISDLNGNVANVATVYITLETLPLFINLHSFTAELLIRNVQLKWTCEKSELLSRIEIERSSNGAQWSVIGIRKPNNTGDYAYLDYLPPFGNNYYRLKLRSVDGEFAYSDIRQVFIPGDREDVRIYPNPAEQEVTIEIPYNTGRFIQLIDESGKVLKSISTQEQYVKFDLGAFASGAYFIKLIDQNGNSKSYKINKI